MTHPQQINDPATSTLRVFAIVLLIILSGCLPSTRAGGYTYQTNIETLYTAVETALSELALNDFDEKDLTVNGLDAYTTIVATFAPQISDVDIPIGINGAMRGLRLYPRYSGEITAAFTSAADGTTSVKFTILDPTKPSQIAGGGAYQQQVYNAGFPIVEEVVRQLDQRFRRSSNLM